MKMLLAVVAIAAVIASPALAAKKRQQARQPAGYQAYAQTWPTPHQAYGQYVPGPGAYSTQTGYYRSDPDPRVRLMIQMDPHP